MTKKELLEKAKRDYPIGTIFIGVGTTNKYELEGFQTANDHWETSGRIIVHCKESTGCGEYLYKDGKWAEIVSKPEVSVYPTDVKYQKGDKVKVLRKAKDRERGWNMVWIESMSLRVGTVLTVQEDNGLEGVLMKEGCRYPHFVLEKVEDMKPQFEEGKWYKNLQEGWMGKFAEPKGSYPFGAFEFSAPLRTRRPFTKSSSLMWLHSDKATLITDLSEIQQYLPDGHIDKLPVEPVKTDVMKELTELPEKWCIYPTINSADTLNRYFHSIGHKYVGYRESWKVVVHGGETNFFHVPQTRNGCWGETSIKPGYKEITFDQFKKWVLKESDTLKREDLVEGEIYRYNYCDNDTNPIIGKCTTSKSSSAIAIGSEYSDYWNPGNFSMAHHMTKATDEEKQWLNACLLCGKFIEKSKALRLTEIVNELDLAIV